MKTFNIQKAVMQILIGALLISLVACGGRGEVVSSTHIGKLIGRHAVSNLHFITETHSGYTNSNGEFVYETGENIQFFDENTLIGKTKATEVITSVSLASTTPSSEALAIKK